MKAHCLFEQSGTFKGVFRECGIEAYDYDILNDFGQTDYVVDIFKEIDIAANEGGGILDTISPDDIVFAFFPCTQFCENNFLQLNGDSWCLRQKSMIEKIEFAQKEHNKLNEHYNHFANMCKWALKNGIKLIIENPATSPHYLTNFFPLRSRIIDKNRSYNGDYYKKPTQFWFINLEPKENLFMVQQRAIKCTVDNEKNKVERSMISKEYAEFFIKTFVL